MNVKEYLKLVDEVVAKGPYTDTWESLCTYRIPDWYRNAKFGIFIHWGVYSVPAFGNEWYPRKMYLEGSPEFEHHRKTYGDHKTFGYKDFIPMFRGERFDADEWLQLFQAAGARYIMPVAEHHDGFQMYDSELSRWNAKQMGPQRDIIGELKQAADQAGIIFSVSDHRAEHCWFFNGGLTFESDIQDPQNEEFYWKQQEGDQKLSHDIYSVPPTVEHCEDWLARVCELVEKYRPRIVWFDWWIQNMGWKPYLKKFAAYYYNRAAEWGTEVAINYKYDAFAYGSAVFDVERGQLESIRPILWQTDTAVAKNSWGYTENNDFKKASDIVCDLVDIVSKNGVMLLNVGPKPDGTITEEDKRVLLAIGEWLKRNGEGIYDTTFWKQFGEGPTRVEEGAFTDVNRAPYTTEDIRFTYRPGVIYAFVMKPPADGRVAIKALRLIMGRAGDFDIKSVSLLGSDARVTFERDMEQLVATIQEPVEPEYPVCLKIAID